MNRRPARRVDVYLSQQDHHGRRTLVVELLRLARRCRVAGATVLRGEEGYGASGAAHRLGPFQDDGTRCLVVVDDVAATDRFLATVARELGDDFARLTVTVSDVEIVDV